PEVDHEVPNPFCQKVENRLLQLGVGPGGELVQPDVADALDDLGLDGGDVDGGADDGDFERQWIETIRRVALDGEVDRCAGGPPDQRRHFVEAEPDDGFPVDTDDGVVGQQAGFPGRRSLEGPDDDDAAGLRDDLAARVLAFDGLVFGVDQCADAFDLAR